MTPPLRALIALTACAAAHALAACSGDEGGGDDGGDSGAGAPSSMAGADGAGEGASAGTGAGASGRSGAGGATGSAGSTPSAGRGGSSGTTGDDAGTTPPGDAATDDAGGAATDPPAGEYGTRADLLEANSEMAVAELDGKIYVLGGYPSSRDVQTTVQVYDPATDAWTLGPPLPIALHHPVVVGVAGKLYSFGGQTTGDQDVDRTLVYDPAGEPEWLDLEAMPTARGAGAAAVIGDVVYVAGGRPPAGNAFEAYDIGDDAWTELAPLPDEFPDRNHLAATAIDGKVYVAGGRHSGGGFASPMTDSLDIYDPATSQWTQGAPMPRPRGGVNGIAAFGCFHVWGGEGGNTGEPNNVFPDHDVYDPIADEWTSLADLPTPVHGVTGAAFVSGLIYIPGGGTQQGGSSGGRQLQVYRPDMRCE